ncbi:MAG TPA: adenosylcobinamide-GDP ribazoletransferase [Jatrophihabitantaceae bacterium]|jgi:adenosylcobinamide-GDP ribazoletransferase
MRTALALFTIVPVHDAEQLTRERAAVALRWLPLLGGGLGAFAALPLTAIRTWAPHATLLGAVLAIGLLVLGSRGLHLDGLADTADGLASRAPADQALSIMRRSDIGPFGVLAVVLAILVDVAALAAFTGSAWRPVAALALAAATGRLAALHAAHRRVPAARATGFGAYVAGSVSTAVAVLETGLVLGAATGLAVAVHAGVAGWLAAPAAALLVVAGVRRHATRRLGGVTGDVFGALIEIGTALTLTGLALR